MIEQLVKELFDCHRTPPFVFGIYFDAKAGPARVKLHRIVKQGTMGVVDFNVPRAALAWCRAALLEGYTVVRIVGRDVVWSARLGPPRRDVEDEIPF